MVSAIQNFETLLVICLLDVNTPQYRKAQRARDQLSDSIRRRLRGSEAFGPMQESGVPKSCMELLGEDQAVQQLLLLVSALVPKAIASVLTSLFSALAKPSSRADVDRCRVDRKYMLRYIQEVCVCVCVRKSVVLLSRCTCNQS